MSSTRYTQEKKLSVLESAKQIGVEEAANIAGVKATTVYNWRNQLKKLGKDAFLAYKPSYKGRGIQKVTVEQQKAEKGVRSLNLTNKYERKMKCQNQRSDNHTLRPHTLHDPILYNLKGMTPNCYQ